MHFWNCFTRRSPVVRRPSPIVYSLWAIGLVLGCSTAPEPTEILWDKWGVPHIYGANDAELFRGFGYAQMESHANLLLKFYGQARGRGAEYWGGDLNLTEDRYVRTMGIPARARAWYDAQTPEFRANLDAYADGVNKYAAEHPDQVADSLEVVLPISAVDVLAHAQRIVHVEGLALGQVTEPRRPPGKGKRAAHRSEQPEQRAQPGGLARSVAADHRPQLARADADVDGRQDAAPAMTHDELAALEQGLLHGQGGRGAAHAGHDFGHHHCQFTAQSCLS